MRRLLNIALLAATALAVAAPTNAGAATPTSIGAYPALYPAFSPKVTDYVSRCQHGRPLLLAVHAPKRTKVRIDGKPGPRKQRLDLGAGQATRVKIGTRTYHVRCIPRSFPKWTSERTGKTQARWYIVTPAEGGKGAHFVAIYDSNGVPIWWAHPPYDPMDAKLLPNGNIAWSRFTGTPYATFSVPYEEHRLNGKLVRKIAAVGIQTDSHELQMLPNGNYLLGGYVPRDGVDLSPYGGPSNAAVTDAEVQEVTPEGKLVWSWNSKDHVALDEGKPFMRAALQQPGKTPDGRPAYDIVHLNAIEPAGDSVLISLRHTDAVYKVSRATGEVIWKLGGTHTDRSLTIEGEPEGSLFFGGQHDVRLQPDGTLTLHDNRTATGLPPRAIRLRVDESARTATKLEEVSDPNLILSLCCGSARKLPGGNWVMSWGFYGIVTETTATGAPLFTLNFKSKLFSYRAVPVLRGGGLSTRRLRAGMDAMYPR